MEKEQLEQRKQMLLSLFQDRQYRPMKLKELAMFLDVAREQRDELKEVLDVLLAEGKISLSTRGNMVPFRRN